MQNERKIFFLLGFWDEDINELRDQTLKSLNQLYSVNKANNQIEIADEIVQKATECHLRQEKKSKKNQTKCVFCKTEEQIKQYELKLFFTTKGSNEEDETTVKGTWKPSAEEYILKALLAFGRSKDGKGDWLKDGETHIAVIEAMRKEFKVPV